MVGRWGFSSFCNRQHVQTAPHRDAQIHRNVHHLPQFQDHDYCLHAKFSSLVNRRMIERSSEQVEKIFEKDRAGGREWTMPASSIEVSKRWLGILRYSYSVMMLESSKKYIHITLWLSLGCPQSRASPRLSPVAASRMSDLPFELATAKNSPLGDVAARTGRLEDDEYPNGRRSPG
jgi:hypothetical protein